MPGRRPQRHAIDYLGRGAARRRARRRSSSSRASAGRRGRGARWQIVGLIVLSIVLLPAFIWVESRAAEPIIPLSLFRNRTFSVTSAVGFIVGFALFGAITYLPLYFQITKGSSPTKSGLQLTPLMAGVLVTSIVSGQLISRLGRYRMFPIAGTAVMALAMFLLSRLEPATHVWVASVYALVLGLGLGMVMQVLVLAAAERGRLPPDRRRDERLDALPPDRRLDRRRALRVDLREPAARRARRSPAGARDHPEDGQPGGRQAPAAGGTQAFEDAFAAALHPVFLVAAAVSVLAFALTWMLREVPLRTGTPARRCGPAAARRSRRARSRCVGRSRRSRCPLRELSGLPDLLAECSTSATCATSSCAAARGRSSRCSGSGSASRSSSRSRASRTASTARRRRRSTRSPASAPT